MITVITTPSKNPEPTKKPEPAKNPEPKQRKHDARAFWNAFKNFALVLSFIIDFILIVVLFLTPDPLFMAKGQIAEPLLLDLDEAFAALGNTKIESTVNIEDTMPVVFDLPLAQNTEVVLVQPVPLDVPATFIWPAGGGAIHGRVQLVLPEGLALPVALNLMVPVSTTVPVVMEVPVEIPLNEAGMGPAIEQLRGVFQPISGLLEDIPDSPKELIQQQLP